MERSRTADGWTKPWLPAVYPVRQEIFRERLSLIMTQELHES